MYKEQIPEIRRFYISERVHNINEEEKDKNKGQLGPSIPHKKLASVSGLFCPACNFFIGTKKDPEKLKGLAQRLQRPVQDLDCIKEVGYEKWYTEMIEHYSCPECSTINSTYDLEGCRKCGATPSNAYVRQHKDEIIQHLAKITALT